MEQYRRDLSRAMALLMLRLFIRDPETFSEREQTINFNVHVFLHFYQSIRPVLQRIRLLVHGETARSS
jgi:hypothetical protein